MTLQNKQCTLTAFLQTCGFAHLSHNLMLATCGCLQQGLATAAAQATCDLSHRAPLQPRPSNLHGLTQQAGAEIVNFARSYVQSSAVSQH